MRPYLLMLAGAMAFAVMGLFAHAADGHCGWQWVALARSALALLIAASLAGWERTPLVFLRPRTLWIRSLAGSLSVLCNFYALSHLPVSDALTLTNMFPVWIAVLSWPMLGRFPERDVWLSVGCSICGVAVMQQSFPVSFGPGMLAAMTGSVTSAVALMGLHRLKGLPASAVVVHFSAVSTVIVAVALGVQSRCSGSGFFAEAPVTFTAGGLLLGVGVAATTGQLLLTRAFASGAPARVSVVGLSQVVFAMLLEMSLWGRRPGVWSFAGMLLVTLPTAWLMLRRVPVASESSPSDV
ncbi:MAG: DMT family transporter [Planctomycetota bacterium]